MSTTVSRFSLVIDDAKSENFLIEIDGELFIADSFVLSQNLMEPNTLRFSLRKGPRDPSTSPANAAFSLERLMGIWKQEVQTYL